jgi:pimeloyl-ACP methyl ester carboxylesterase
MGENHGRLRRWAGAQDVSLVAEAFGEEDAPPIIFVHGGGQSRFAWRSGALAAAEAGFLAISIDQRGHGDSGWSPDGDYSPAAVASDIQALMAQLDRPAVLVGASRGGYGTLVAAARGGPLARALVLVEIAPRIDQTGAEQVRGFMRASAAGFVDVEEAADLLSRYMFRKDRKDPERLRRSMRRDDSGRWFWRWDPRVANGVMRDPVRDEDRLEDAARRITCPVLLVRGERSELVKEEHVAHLRTLIPGVRVHTIAGVGHMVSGDENDLFNVAIIDFISGLPEPAVEACR